MNRRTVVVGLCGGLDGLPCMATSQPAAMPTIGVLRSTPAAPFAHIVAAFRRGLSDAGFVEGQNVSIEFR